MRTIRREFSVKGVVFLFQRASLTKEHPCRYENGPTICVNPTLGLIVMPADSQGGCMMNTPYAYYDCAVLAPGSYNYYLNTKFNCCFADVCQMLSLCLPECRHCLQEFGAVFGFGHTVGRTYIATQDHANSQEF